MAMILPPDFKEFLKLLKENDVRSTDIESLNQIKGKS